MLAGNARPHGRGRICPPFRRIPPLEDPLTTLAHNLILLLFDAGALALVTRRKRTPAPILGAALLAAGAMISSVCLAEDTFGFVRLGCWAIFLHGTGMAAASAVLLRRRSRRAALALAGLAGVLAVVAVDAFLIEPHWLEVTHVRLTSAKVSRPLRILILADIQVDRVGAYEREALTRGLAEKPDVILLAGDYIQAPDAAAYSQLRRELNALFYEVGLRAPLGVFAVPGNLEVPGWQLLFSGIPATCFTEYGTVSAGPVSVTGLTFPESGFPRTLVPAVSGFHIALGHDPSFAVGPVDADLLVAGHTHGGQVRIPFIGPMFRSTHVPRRWMAGVTPLSGGRTLIVSRGVGMERGHAPRFRFLCRPEIVVVDVAPAR